MPIENRDALIAKLEGVDFPAAAENIIFTFRDGERTEKNPKGSKLHI